MLPCDHGQTGDYGLRFTRGDGTTKCVFLPMWPLLGRLNGPKDLRQHATPEQMASWLRELADKCDDLEAHGWDPEPRDA